jgi:hypothetical protein
VASILRNPLDDRKRFSVTGDRHRRGPLAGEFSGVGIVQTGSTPAQTGREPLPDASGRRQRDEPGTGRPKTRLSVRLRRDRFVLLVYTDLSRRMK